MYAKMYAIEESALGEGGGGAHVHTQNRNLLCVCFLTCVRPIVPSLGPSSPLRQP